MYDKEHLVENVLLITRINQALKKNVTIQTGIEKKKKKIKKRISLYETHHHERNNKKRNVTLLSSKYTESPGGMKEHYRKCSQLRIFC